LALPISRAAAPDTPRISKEKKMDASRENLGELQRLLDDMDGRGQTMLLPALLNAQKQFGYVPEEAAAAIGETLKVPLAEIFGVMEFYDLLTAQPTARTVIRFCNSAICAQAGGGAQMASLCSSLGLRPGEPGVDGEYQVSETPCLGLCDHAPAVLAGERLVGEAGAADYQAWLEPDGSPGYKLSGEPRWLTERVGKVRPLSLDDFLANKGYQALRQVLQMMPAEVIQNVRDSGLVGRGGAAFPMGIKLDGAAAAPGELKYIVLNADESEVGTFKDRVLMEYDPYSVLEGMAIAAYAVGASQGFIYVRGEYQHAQKILAEALVRAEDAGYLGDDILGSGLNFHVELRSGAGAYICGEETALFESIEGKRGFPRIKPPFPTTHGLFGKPTVINNVETICNLPLIFREGVAAYRQLGTQKSPGPKLFCLSGDLRQPGLVEAPFGLTLRELIENYGGGAQPGQHIQAVLLGGAAGYFVPPDQLDVRLTFEDLRAAGLALGSGAVMVFDDRRDLRQVLLNLAHFFADESCGKCYPCQLGTQRQVEILGRLVEGRWLDDDWDRLQDVGWTMGDASLCGLGQTAALAVLSAMQHWPELFSSE
jgi:NADH-quinone oxidoreductase subunit F